eukprot:9473962-Pyramimonas_sp.AAC.1
MKTVRILTEWSDNIFAALPHRSTLVLYTDLNDGQGISRSSGKWNDIEADAVGAGRSREHRLDGAGLRLRRLHGQHQRCWS